MYTTVKGYYENGQVTIIEPAPPGIQKSEVMITFLKEPQQAAGNENDQPREAGWLKKWGEERGLHFSIPDDFNAPLDDLKDYM